MIKLDIIYQDDSIVAINKPYGYFVHRSKMDSQSTQVLMPILRDQVGQFVYPAHRLDKKTTGVLLFALNKPCLINLNSQFQLRTIKKKYWAIVRGWTKDKDVIDYPLTNDSGKTQEALTSYSCVDKVEIMTSSGRYPTSRYSLLEVSPLTGRMHQIRKHLDHIFHPIIGDRPYGCNKQNRFFLKEYNFQEMLLHASRLGFKHPLSGKKIQIQAPLQNEFKRIIIQLGINDQGFDKSLA